MESRQLATRLEFFSGCRWLSAMKSTCGKCIALHERCSRQGGARGIEWISTLQNWLIAGDQRLHSACLIPSLKPLLERVYDLYAVTLCCNRVRVRCDGAQNAPMCIQGPTLRNRPISVQPLWTAALRSISAAVRETLGYCKSGICEELITSQSRCRGARRS